MPPPNQREAFWVCCARRAGPAHACHEFALPRGCSPKPSSPPQKKNQPTRGINSGTPFPFPPRLTRAPRGSPAGRRELGQGTARRCPHRAGGRRCWCSSCPPPPSRCKLGRGQEAVKAVAGGTGQCRGLAAHRWHRGVPARCPGSRPRAGGSCCARRCWGAGWAPQRRPGGEGARGTGRCPTASSRGAAAAHPSAALDGGARGWGRVVPASRASWGGTGHGDSPPHPTHAPNRPQHPISLLPSASLPPPVPQTPSEGASSRRQGRTRCPGGDARGCAPAGTPGWPPSPRSRCPSPATPCAAPATPGSRTGALHPCETPAG